MFSKNNQIFIFLLLFYFFFQLFLILNTKLTFFSDDAIYATLARLFYNGNYSQIIHPFWMPLFPILSSITYSFIKNWEISLRLVSTLSTTLMLIPLFWMAKNSLSPLISIIFIVSLISNFIILKVGIFPQSDALATLLLISSLSFFYYSFFTNTLKRKNLFILLAATFCGLNFLTRPEGTLFLTIYLSFLTIYFFVEIIFLKKYSYKQFLILPAFIFVFLSTISPYVLSLSAKLGYFTISPKFNAQIQQEHAFAYKNMSTWNQHTSSAKNPNLKSAYFKGGTDYILDNTNRLKIWFFQKMESWWRIYKINFPLWFLYLLPFSFLTAFRKKYTWSTLFVFYTILIAIPVTIFSTAITDIRYLLWTIPIFLFLFLLFCDYVLNLIKESELFPKKYLNLLPLIPLFLIFTFDSTLKQEFLSINKSLIAPFDQINYRPELLGIANQLQKTKPNPKIMMRHEMLEFYTDGEIIYTPQTSIENVINYAKTTKTDFIVAWKRELEGEKELEELANPKFENSNLEKVYFINTSDGPLVVYKVKPNL